MKLAAVCKGDVCVTFVTQFGYHPERSYAPAIRHANLRHMDTPSIASLVQAPSLLARRISSARSLSLVSDAATALLASYPKSGRTWLRFILAQYFLASRQYAPITTQSMFTFAPNFDLDPVRGIPAFVRRSEEASFPLVPSTHLRFKPTLPSRLPVIFLIRDPRAVLISDYHHVTRHKMSFRGSIDDFLVDQDRGLSHYIKYMNSWATGLARHDHHIIYYEDLLADTESEVEKMLIFLDEPVNFKALQYAVENSSFEKLKALELAQGIPGHDYDRSDADALRIRKGQSDSFREELTIDQQKFIEDSCKSQLDRRMLARLERYGFLDIQPSPAAGQTSTPKPAAPKEAAHDFTPNRRMANLGVQLLSEAMVIIGLAAMIIAPPILVIEVGEWLFRREWDGHSLEDGLALFGIDRVGPVETPTEQFLDVLLALPLTITLFLYGLFTLLAGVHFGDWGLHGVRLKKKLAVRQSRKSRKNRTQTAVFRS
jgi:hypothetical protein